MVLTIEVDSDDEVIFFEEAPAVQVLVGNESAPSKVFPAEALAADIPLCT